MHVLSLSSDFLIGIIVQAYYKGKMVIRYRVGFQLTNTRLQENPLVTSLTTTELVNEETRLERKLLKQELDSMYEQKAAGYQVRSLAQWVEKGEKVLSIF